MEEDSFDERSELEAYRRILVVCGFKRKIRKGVHLKQAAKD